MTEPSHSAKSTGGAAERDKPAVPPMRDAETGIDAGAMPGAPEAPAVPAVPGGAVPGGGAVVEPEQPSAAPVRIKHTRISGLWTGIIVAAVVLLLLLVFIVQNNSYVTIYFFGWGGEFPLGVALLLAAICGVLLVAIPGYGRIIQLRRSFRKANTRK
ncbi:LapA family protein [Kutzneria chonburiensis]|uniref:Lipopolysaccharide assembly LapA domain-containing protein n=1 Tax=Kutzneria chonburiensis TaxID=1483604 RepID=A0ABV6MPJ5_9PSEU|nr:LapA family protein [Kutzneria chonburiensis]